MDDVTRRRAVTLAAAGAAAAIGGGDARAQEARGQAEARKGGGRRYTGTSKQGDLKEALDLAINKALKAAPGADRQVRWTLQEISGVRGGFVPTNEVTVTIEAHVV